MMLLVVTGAIRAKESTMAKKLSPEQKLANKAAKHISKMKQFVANALDKKKSLNSLGDYEVVLLVLHEKGQLDEDALTPFGSSEHPLTLSLDSVHDTIPCEQCGFENRVSRRDIPHILTILKQFANGMANEFRRLKDVYGLQISKVGELVVVEGISPVNEAELRPNIPQPVRKYWEKKIDAGNVICPHKGNDHRCYGQLTNSPKNWFLDHKLFTKNNPSYKDYNLNEATKYDPNSYEPLCESCSCDDREDVKPARQEFLSQK